MRTVRHILAKKGADVATIEADQTVLDAARIMSDRHIGSLVVTEGEKVIGIFTERDVLNRVVAAGKAAADVHVRDVMTAPVACCKPETSETECRAVMRAKRIRHLPVVEDERLVGVISIGDIIEDENAEQQQTIEYLYEYMHGSYR